MPKDSIVSIVQSGKILVSDGAWGTLLHEKGLAAGECPEGWCLHRFHDLVDIAERYFAAGADMVGTNSFGGSSFKLAHYHLADKARQINEAAARASRQAAGDDRRVMGSIGPTGKMLLMEEVTPEEMYESFREQAGALEAGGADALCIETMSDIQEASLAIRAAKEHTKAELICTFTFEPTLRGDYRTMMGVSPEEAAMAAMAAGADIIGANCGNGMEGMIAITTQMRRTNRDIPILVHANAGLPCLTDGQNVFPATPADMARLVPSLAKAGANIIGGCCGTTPLHIQAICEAVKAVNLTRGHGC